jgi:hypothetical protein
MPGKRYIKHAVTFLDTIASCINNAIMDVEVRDTYAQIEGERRSS